jgi:hypothetical protein
MYPAKPNPDKPEPKKEKSRGGVSQSMLFLNKPEIDIKKRPIKNPKMIE